jgi:alpha-tubulin suppressor-like RCC1 family protein
MNLLLVDSTVFEVDLFTRACNENTKFVIYDSHKDTFDTVKQKIAVLNVTVFSNLAFAFIDQHHFLNFFVSNNTFISLNSDGIQENNTTKFIKELVENYNITTIDFLACNLLKYQEWRQYFEFLKKDNNNKIKIRASNDRTGNLNSGGDWVLETTDEDVKTLYFTELINNWHHVLDLGNHFAITSNEAENNLYVTGYNYYGQLGRGNDMRDINKNIFTNKDINNNILLNSPELAYKKILSASCGENHTVIVTNDATNNLYVAGRNNEGQLGLGDNVNKNTFTRVTTGKKIVSASCGWYHTVIVTEETNNMNNLYVAGYNGFGQLGLGDNVNKNTFTQVTTTGKKILSAYCSEYHTVIVTEETDNNLYVVGNNNVGQLGLGDNVNKNTFTQVTTTGKKILSASCGVNHTVIVTNDATNNLYVAGSNGSGQLGLGDNVNKNTFTQVTTVAITGKKILSASCGRFHTIIVTDDATNNLYVAGSNEDGQLGLGDNVNKNTFTRTTIGKKMVINQASLLAPSATTFDNFNFGNNATYYTSASGFTNNTITQTVLNNTSTQITLELSPADTIFANYINFTQNVKNANSVKVYMKSSNDANPHELLTTDNGYGAYYEILNGSQIKIYTKHFTELIFNGIFTDNKIEIIQNKIINCNGTIKFKWFPVKGAKYYIVNRYNGICKTAEKKFIIKNTHFEDNSWDTSENLIRYNIEAVLNNKKIVSNKLTYFNNN